MMGPRDLVEKGMEENLSYADKASSGSESVIVVPPEYLPSLDNSTSTNHTSGEAIASNAVAADSETKCHLMGSRRTPITNGDGGKASCIIDIKYGDDDRVEKMCRICQLDSDLQEPEMGSKIWMDVIELGCSCKGELGYAHSHCAAAWFQLKGNRMCEICGQNANNITRMTVDHTFMEQWNDNRLSTDEEASLAMGARCWQGQPLCNLLMACLVILFVIPWFLRVSIF